MDKENKTNGLGDKIYGEWIIPVVHYYGLLEKRERNFEIVIPAVVGIICTGCYWYAGKIHLALDSLAELLPTVVSILIGFTAMLITLLLTSSSENIEKLKERKFKKKIEGIRGKKVTLFQGLHIQFSHSLFSEILLIFVVFFYLFLKGLACTKYVGQIFLFVEIYFVLNILLSILRGVANLYFSFFESNEDVK